MKRLLLVGGGHAHVEVLRRLALEPEPGVDVTLISPHRHTPDSGMLPGLIADHYTFDEAHIDPAPLAARAGVNFALTRVQRLDPGQHVAHCDDGSAVEFDACAIDIGSTPRMDTPGAREHTVGVKPIEHFLQRWELEIGRAQSGAHDDIAVVGGGAGGLEVLLAMQHAARSAMKPTGQVPRFHLVTDTPTILPSHSARVRRIFMRLLGQRGVVVHCRARVIEVTARQLRCEDGRTIGAGTIVWATSAAAAPWIAESGLAVDAGGFMLVDSHLESTSHPCIFGSGDIAALESVRLPKSGVFAVREGPVLAHNLRCALRGSRRLPFMTKPSALALISTGDRQAVMAWGRWALSGRWVWRWKDWIDRRFMERYRRGVQGALRR